MNIFFADEQDEPLETDSMVHMAERVLTAEGLPAGTEVSIVLVGEDQMAQYNRRFMERSGPTDVLAFPIEQLTPGESPKPSPGGQPLSLGDIFICPAVVKAQAANLKVPLDHELALIVTHGLLHLLGYDHSEKPGAEMMSARERELLALQGIQIP